MTSLAKLEELIKELISKVDNVSTNENLEVIAAKIIKEVSEKISKETIQGLHLEKQKDEKPRGLLKYSFPNFNVGNPSLGSSKSPNALKWPFGSSSND